jgi:ABC-type taurine transport system substrate-binding protein
MKEKGMGKERKMPPSKSVKFHGVPIVSTGEGFQWGLFAAGDTAVGVFATGRVAIGILASGAVVRRPAG